jgi:uncharacterized membrane protein
MKVEKKRHIAKAISYRLLSSFLGFFVVWISSGSIKIGATFTFAELVYKPIIFYIHERYYYKFVKFGLKNELSKDKDSKLS